MGMAVEVEKPGFTWKNHCITGVQQFQRQAPVDITMVIDVGMAILIVSICVHIYVRYMQVE